MEYLKFALVLPLAIFAYQLACFLATRQHN